MDKCPFCNKQATASNKQKVPVCIKHRDSELLDLKCICGDWLDLLEGKYGPYFKCMRCGNVSFSRAMEINADKIISSEKPKPPSTPKKKTYTKEKKETTNTSDMVDIYF